MLLETGFVFFVHDDQAQFGQRKQHRGPRTYNELTALGIQHRHPRFCALPVREAAVVNVNDISEEPTQTLDQLGCQGNLRHQEQDLLSCREHLGNEVRVNLGLAGSRDAVQQHRLPFDEARVNFIVSFCLGVRQHGHPRGARLARTGRFALLHHQDAPIHPFLDSGGVGAAALLGLHLGKLLFFNDGEQQALHGHRLDPGPRQGGRQLLLGDVVGHADPTHQLGLDALVQLFLRQRQTPLQQRADGALRVLDAEQLCAISDAHVVSDVQGIEQHHGLFVQPCL